MRFPPSPAKRERAGVRASAFEPVPVPLGQVGQGLERRHPVGIYLPLQVIVFVLDHSGMKVPGDKVERIAVPVQRFNALKDAELRA